MSFIIECFHEQQDLTLLESITKVPDQQVTELGKLSIFFLLSSFYCDNTIMAETITTEKNWSALTIQQVHPRKLSVCLDSLL